LADLNDLSFGKEELDIDLSDMPEQIVRGDYTPRQPGWYTYKLPEDFDFSMESDNDGKQFLRVNFRGANSLTYKDEPTRRHSDSVDTKVRYVGDEGRKVASLAYLLKEGFGVTKKLKGHQDAGQALIDHAGEYFRGRLEWSGRCRDCGTNYREKEVKPKKEGGWEAKAIPRLGSELAQDFECVCGADVRAFANIRGFAKAAA